MTAHGLTQLFVQFAFQMIIPASELCILHKFVKYDKFDLRKVLYKRRQ